MSVLSEIVQHKVREVAATRVMRPFESVREAADMAPAPRDFDGALRAPGLCLFAVV